MPTSLQFTFPDPSDFRTANILEPQANGEHLTLFKIQTYSNTPTAETEFLRFNKLTGKDEWAGGIRWEGRTTVSFGAVNMSLHELRRRKKPSSQSRRFKWNNSEYKWKRTGTGGRNLTCYDWFKRVIASYNDDTRYLEVSDRGYALLDQLVVTCLLHRWTLSQGYW